MNFLEAVNRVLRSEGILMGDDDDLTSFTETQHAANSSLAQIAIQSELSNLVSDGYLQYEEKSTSLTLAVGTRTYSLASDFQHFLETFLDREDGSGNAEGNRILLYPGGEGQLRKDFNRYREETGNPIYFYPAGGTTKNIGLYPVPNSDVAGDVYRYYYEADVNVSVTTDVLPFHSTTEAQVFIRMCARRFKYLHATPAVRESLFPQGIEGDGSSNSARATLMGLLNPLPPKRKYGKLTPRGR